MPRTLRVTPEDQIVPDWPKKAVKGRKARIAAYRAQREAREPQKPTQPFPGHVSAVEMFPDWDWAGHPEGPPLDDPAVKAYTEIMWKSFLRG